jgi:hypothetical protein
MKWGGLMPATWPNSYLSQNPREQEDLFGTFLPGSDGTTRLNFLAEDQPGGCVPIAKVEVEECGVERQAANMMGENRRLNPVVQTKSRQPTN